MKVSAIIPNYNHAKYLKERIESVLGQDYPDMEIIMLDDCSTDESVAIMEDYATHPKVKKIIKGETNSGNTFVQWRKGIEKAQGEYIWIAESDDVAEKELVSTLVQPMEDDQDVCVSFCQSKWINQDGNPIRSTVYKHWTKGFVMDGKTFIERYLLGYNHICNASAVVMRKSAAKKVSDRCMQYKASGDRQFWIEMAAQGKVSYSSRVMNAFRQHEHKVSNHAAMTGQNIQEDLSIYLWWKEVHHLSVVRRVKTLLYHLRASINVRHEYRKAIQHAWLKQW